MKFVIPYPLKACYYKDLKEIKSTRQGLDWGCRKLTPGIMSEANNPIQKVPDRVLFGAAGANARDHESHSEE